MLLCGNKKQAWKQSMKNSMMIGTMTSNFGGTGAKPLSETGRFIQAHIRGNGNRVTMTGKVQRCYTWRAL
jgi:hypothetical protein